MKHVFVCVSTRLTSLSTFFARNPGERGGRAWIVVLGRIASREMANRADMLRTRAHRIYDE